MELKENKLNSVRLYLKEELKEFDLNIINYIVGLKLNAIEEKNEKLANECWILEHIFIVKQKYIQMFENLTNAKYRVAWDELEQIEIIIGDIFNNIECTLFEEYGLSLIRNNIFSFQELYPYILFGSRESVILKETCSICGRQIGLRDACTHLKGKLYMGQLCLYKDEKMEYKSIAIVRNPMDKHCVLEPEGKEFNYGMLEELMKYITGPYEKIKVDSRMILKPEYQNIGRNQRCPCGSGKKYKKCCLNTDNEKMEHKTIIFNHHVKPTKMRLFNTYAN